MSSPARHRAAASRNSSPLDRLPARHRKPTTTVSARGVAAVTVSAGVALSGTLITAPAANADRGLRGTPGHPAVSTGDSGHEVRRVQRQLYVSPTSYFGSQTRTAVKQFQATIGLYPSGVVERRTWSALDYMWRHQGRLQSGQTYKQVLLQRARAQARSAPAPSAAPSAFSSRVIQTAYRYSGGRYRYGGTGPRNFDCSGYTKFVYGKLGYRLPRTANAQKNAVKRIPRSMARPGDLIFFTSGGNVYHGGIYGGPGVIWHSSKPGRPVGKGKIWTYRGVVFGTVR